MRKRFSSVVFLCLIVVLALAMLPVSADVNNDGKWDIIDICIIVRAFGTDPTWPFGTGWDQWNPAADLNFDNKVDLVDLNIARNNFGTGVSSLSPTNGPNQVRLVPTPSTQIGSFNLDVQINMQSNQPGVSQYQFMVNWNPYYIQFDSVIEGPFLSSGGMYATVLAWYLYPSNDRLLVGGSLLVPETSSGSGILATICFNCVNPTPGNSFSMVDLTSNLYDINFNTIGTNDHFALVNQD